MAINIDDAFEIGKNGIAISDDDGNILYYQAAGSGPPFGSQAPLNTRYLDHVNQVRYRKVGPGTTANDWLFDVPKFPFCVIDAGEFQTSQVLEAFDNAGGASIPDFPTIDSMPFPSVRPGSELSTYNFPAIGEIQFQQAGDYWAEGHISFTIDGGGSDKQCAAIPQINTGSGFTTILGAFGFATVGISDEYHSAPFGCLLSGVNIGDIFRIGMTKLSGSGAQTAFGSSLRIRPVTPKTNIVALPVDAGEFDGNQNKEPKATIDAGEL